MATYTVLQSPMEYSGPCTHHLLPQKQTPRDQRPKLALNTSPHRSFGRASTGLRLDTVSTSSPTSCNTYKNSYDPQAQNIQVEALPTRSGSQAIHAELLDGQPRPSLVPSLPKPLLEARAAPYTLPPNTRSILTNGPLAKRQRPPPTPSAFSPLSSSPSPFVSAVKRVCFRDPVSEDIKTTEYLPIYFDLRSRSTSPAPHKEGNMAHESGSGTPKTSGTRQPPPKAREVAPKGQFAADDDDEDDCEEVEVVGSDDEDTYLPPKTPIAGRNKKEREWVWTLGPLPGLKGPGSSISSSECSEEDLYDSLGESVAAASGFSVT